MTRADEGEGREPSQDDLVARFAVEERTALVGDLSDLQACLSVDGRAHSAEIIARAVIALTAAEAEVARLTAALSEAGRERDEVKAKVDGLEAIIMADDAKAMAEYEWQRANIAFAERDAARIEGETSLRRASERLARQHDAEASASALRERVATLEAALQPFAKYAADMPGADFGEGEIGEYYHDGFRRSICTQDLRAARTALEANHAED